MKKTLFAAVIALLGCLPFASRAQYAIPLADLQKVCNKNANDFETFMLTNDYSLQSKLSNATTKIYWSDKAGVADKKYVVNRSQVPNAAVNLMFTTTDKKWYLELKKQLAATGYKFVKEENKTVNGAQANCSDYSNGKFQVSVYSYTTDAPYFGVQMHL